MAGMYGCFKGRNSDSVAMASGPPDVMANQEPAEVVEECSGKKKSKFQTFKKLFARKKRKEASASGGEAGLKASQSSDSVNNVPEDNTLTRSEKGSGSKVSLGNKALSHDSVFVSDSSEALGASQDSIHGKVKSLQLQLKQAIRLGSPPSLMCVKRMEDAGAMSEDDGLPCSPPEYSTLHTVLNQAQGNSSLSLDGTDSDEDQLSCAASSRAMSPLVVVPGDFSQPASPFGCLDTSAAKHKLGLRHKACTKRKPASRVEIRAEEDSVVEETLNTSTPEAAEEREEQETGDVGGDQLRPKKEEGEEEEADRLQHSKQSPSRDEDEVEEERKEGEDELEAGQDVSHSAEASSPLQRRLSEEDAPDAQPPASSKPSSRASSLGTPRATPEPPACQREYLLDPPGTAYGREENEVESDFTLGEDGILSDVGGEIREEESSFLQEVLNSLKTPLTSCSLVLEAEGVLLEMEEEVKESKAVLEMDEEVKDSEAEVEDVRETEEEEREEVDTEEGEEMQEEDAEVDEPVTHQAPPFGSMTLPVGQPDQEEEVVALSRTSSSCEAVEKEEEDENEEEEEEEKEEEEAIEPVVQHGQEEEGEKEEAQEVGPEYCAKEEENDLPSDKQEEEEGEEGESEGEEEAIELEKELEVDEEGWEKMEEEREERVEEAEEALEEEVGEEMMETAPDAADDTVQTAMADEGLDVVLGEDSVSTPEHSDQTQIPAKPCEQIFTLESQAASNQSSGDEREVGEERAEEAIEMEQKSDQVEETNQPDVEQADGDQVGVEIGHLDTNYTEEDQRDQMDMDQTVTEQAAISFTSSFSLPESQGYSETPTSEKSETGVPSMTSADATVHIRLVSPSSEPVTSPLLQPPSGEDATEEVDESPVAAAARTELVDTMEGGEEEEEEEEEGKQTFNAEATTEEEARPASNPDQNRAQFTIVPAWQRSLSTGGGSIKEPVTPPSPSSLPPCLSSTSPLSPSVIGPEGAAVTSTTKEDPLEKAEPASSVKADVVLSPSRPRSVGSSAAKPQTSTAATTEESPVLAEGNPENPFGVRLRKTVLHRYGSEEENPEPALEPPAQPTVNKVDPPQPIGVKPSISQPVSMKPALPRKPEVHGDSGGKNKRISDPAAGRGVSAGSDSPSWISVARQKQKTYKDNSLDNSTVKKEEPERKSSLPLYVSSAACREHAKTPESTGRVSSLEITKPAAPMEKEARRAFSPPTPVSPQSPKTQLLPCPKAPKPLSQLTPATPKHPPHPTPSQRALSPPTPVPVSQRAPSCTSPPSLSKSPLPHPVPLPTSKTPHSQSSTPPIQRPPAQPSSALTSPPISSRTTVAQSGSIPSRAPGLSSPTSVSQRGLPTPGSPPPALPQDEPPWMALAKKKAKAWSEMPQIVQ